MVRKGGVAVPQDPREQIGYFKKLGVQLGLRRAE